MSFRHDDRSPADLRLDEHAFFDIETEDDQARALHLETLLDDEGMVAIRYFFEGHQHAGESGGCRAGRRILGDAEGRGEHARVKVMSGHTFARIEESMRRFSR